jgi:hypothetical protein
MQYGLEEEVLVGVYSRRRRRREREGRREKE